MINELESLGLSNQEAKIYLYLLKNKNSTAGRISKDIKINRTTTYDILERLVSKGFVSYNLGANIKHFSSTDPDNLVKYFEEKKDLAESTVPKLKNLEKPVSESFEIFEGRKGIKAIFWDILNYKEYVAFGSSGKIMDTMKHDFVLFQKQKKKLGIKSRILQNEVDEELRSVAFGSFKILHDSNKSPVTTIIYADKVAILTWGQTPHGILITSKDISNQFMDQFEHLWKLGEKT